MSSMEQRQALDRRIAGKAGSLLWQTSTSQPTVAELFADLQSTSPSSQPAVHASDDQITTAAARDIARHRNPFAHDPAALRDDADPGQGDDE